MKCAGILFAFVAALAAVQAVDYCPANLCGPGQKHIACGHSGKFASTCPANARIVNIKPHIAAILSAHNEKRNQIASGKLSGYKPAVRMAVMRWDDELAKMAELNVMQCAMKHDQCRNTATFKSSGQNLASMSYSGDESRISDTDIIKGRIDQWWNEYTNAKMAHIDMYPPKYQGPAIGHFTVMTGENNRALGCALMHYSDGKWNNALMACNYATTNMIGSAMYVSGPAASGCTKGKDATYSSLCSA